LRKPAHDTSNRSRVVRSEITTKHRFPICAMTPGVTGHERTNGFIPLGVRKGTTQRVLCPMSATDPRGQPEHSPGAWPVAGVEAPPTDSATTVTIDIACSDFCTIIKSPPLQIRLLAVRSVDLSQRLVPLIVKPCFAHRLAVGKR